MRATAETADPRDDQTKTAGPWGGPAVGVTRAVRGDLPGAEGGVRQAARADLDAVAAVDLGRQDEAAVAALGDAVDGEGPAGHVAGLAAVDRAGQLVATGVG